MVLGFRGVERDFFFVLCFFAGERGGGGGGWDVSAFGFIGLGFRGYILEL